MPSPKHYLRMPTIAALTSMPTLAQWRDRALCSGHGLPPSTWDDAVGDRLETAAARNARVGRAKEVCARCPVKAECMDDVDMRYDEGIRGGVDLRDLKRAMRRGGAA